MTTPTDVKTVEGSFEAYLQMLFKNIEIGPVQRAELRKAYYAGVFWLLTVQSSYMAFLSEEEGIKFLEGIQDECVAFAMSLPDNGPGGMTNEPVHPSH